MKKIYLFTFFVFLSSFVNAAYNSFYNANLESIKDFTKDIGNVSGSSTLYSARALGFGGFGISYKSVYQLKPSQNNTIFDKNKAFTINFLQAEIGVPSRFDTYLRAGGDSGLNIIGGGVRYGLRNITEELYKINMILSLNSHMGLYKFFYFTNFGAQLAFSMKLSNWFMPYISCGFDTLKLKIKNNTDSSIVGKSIYDDIQRYSVGMRLKFKLVNLSIGFDIYDTRTGLNGSFGFRF